MVAVVVVGGTDFRLHLASVLLAAVVPVLVVAVVDKLE